MATKPNAVQATKYTHSSRANFLDWKRDLDAVLIMHPDKLLTVVQERKLAPSVRTRLVSQHSKGTNKWDETVEKGFVVEFNNTAYHILLPTIGDDTFRREMERKHGQKQNAHLIYKAICAEWSIDDTTSDERIVAKDKERKQLIDSGIKSGSLAHTTEFVEAILAVNYELESTSFFWKDVVLVTYVLDAIQFHHEAFVLAYKGSKTGQGHWKDNFDVVWREVRTALESNNLSKESSSHRQSDVLMTDSNQSVVQALVDQVAALTAQVQSLQNNNNSRCYATSSDRKRPEPEECKHCGQTHIINKKYECLGKALAEGQMTDKEAEKIFAFAKSPKGAVEKIKGFYAAHQAKIKGTTTKPVKSVQFMVNTSTKPISSSVLKVDTQAEDTILNDESFFDFIDTTITMNLSTINGATSAYTAGKGTARMKLKDGIEITIENAHFYPGAAANILATRRVADKAFIDFASNGMRLISNNQLLPFDSGYCAFEVHPCRNTSECLHLQTTIQPRHPEAAYAILFTGVNAFGGLTAGPRSQTGLR